MNEGKKELWATLELLLQFSQNVVRNTLDRAILIVILVRGIPTSCMNFLQIGRISLLSVALNIITCFWCGVNLKTS